jgi:basic amino acid/polyamine antiporter, APA family
LEKTTTAVRNISLATAIAVVIANMIGTGVFTSLGFQLAGIKSLFAILMLWLVGGLVALCGALCYGELAVRYPGSGGEYNYLSKIYHPALGFLSGWVSATVGFAAPIGLSSIAFTKYLTILLPALSGYETLIACGLIVLVAVINLMGVKLTSLFQRSITYVNIFSMAVIIIAGLLVTAPSDLVFSMEAKDWADVMSPSFAVSLIYVSFAYSGWNSATYIAGEITNPNKNLPRALFGATSLVMVLYVLLNFVFLHTVPMQKLTGQLEVGFIAAQAIFGTLGGKFICVLIGMALFASVNSMTISGPRVIQTIGEDFSLFKFFARKNTGGSPLLAILLQTTMALLLVITSTFEKVLLFIGFTLSLFTTLTVIGLLVARFQKKPEPGLYQTPLFPIPAVIFIFLEFYSMYWSLTERTEVSLYGIGLVLLGLLIYFIAEKYQQDALEDKRI